MWYFTDLIAIIPSPHLQGTKAEAIGRQIKYPPPSIWPNGQPDSSVLGRNQGKWSSYTTRAKERSDISERPEGAPITKGPRRDVGEDHGVTAPPADHVGFWNTHGIEGQRTRTPQSNVSLRVVGHPTEGARGSAWR